MAVAVAVGKEIIPGAGDFPRLPRPAPGCLWGQSHGNISLDSGGNSGQDSRMARPLRFEYADAVYQVMARGNGDKAIFIAKADHLLFPLC